MRRVERSRCPTKHSWLAQGHQGCARKSAVLLAPYLDVATLQRDICRARLRSVSRDISRHLPKS